MCLLSGLLIFVACAKQAARPVETASPALAAIDSLMWQQPDSALAYLLPYFDTCCRDVSRNVSTTYNRHYAHLLLAELLYKNDYAQTNRAELQQAVVYFDSLNLIINDQSHASWRHCGLDPQSPILNDNLIFLDARAHYINGVGYYENDSVVEACAEYIKALDVMEEPFEEMELRGKKAQFVAITHTHLTELFSNYYLYEPTLYFGKKSLDYFQKYDANVWHIAWVLNEMGIHYDMINELDSADCYYKKAYSVLDDTNYLMYRDIATNLARLEYKKNPIKVDSILAELYLLLSKSESNNEYLARNLVMGEIFYQEKQFDSAWNYLYKVYNETTNVGAKKQSAERLVDLCKVIRNGVDVVEYADYLVPFANQEENNSELKSRLIEQYNTVRIKELGRLHEKEATKQRQTGLLIFGGLLVMILTMAVFYSRNKKSKQKIEAQMESERYVHKMQQAALAGRLKRSNAALNKQEKTSQINPSEASNQNKARCLVEEPICKHIITICNDKNNPLKSSIPVSVYADLALTDVQKAQLKNAVIGHYGLTFEKLKQQYPQLKEKDFIYCYLCVLGLDNTQIAVLLQNSISTTWDRENRLKQIFHSEDKVSLFLHRIIISDYQDIT